MQWVQDGSPSKSTPIKVESPNQFVPLGTSKKEFRRIQTAVFTFNIYIFTGLVIEGWKGTLLPNSSKVSKVIISPMILI